MTNSIRKHRLMREWTQEELASKISVSRQTIFAIETGKYVPSVLIALKLAKTMEMQIEELFALEATD
jgi:putative transcriptional regulator